MSPQYGTPWVRPNDAVTACGAVRVGSGQIVLWGPYSIGLEVVFLIMPFKMLFTFSAV